MVEVAFKPCPFCGYEEPSDMRDRGVKCPRCHAWGPATTSSVAHWNMRADARVAEAVAAERSACAALCEGIRNKSERPDSILTALHCEAAIRARSAKGGEDDK